MGAILALGGVLFAVSFFLNRLPSIYTFEKVIWIGGSALAGGGALILWSIPALVREVIESAKTSEELAEANLQLLIDNPYADPRQFVVDWSDVVNPKIEKIGVLRQLTRSEPEEGDLADALEASVNRLNQSGDKNAPHLKFLAVKLASYRETSSLPRHMDQTAEDEIPSLFGFVAEKVEVVRSERRFPPGYAQPVYKKGGRFYYKEEEENHGWEAARIGLETQGKRLGRGITFNHAFLYFSRGETDADIYQLDPPLIASSEPSLHNIGHATLLIQLGGINVLTDPTFGNLDPIFYRRKTRPGLMPHQLPRIHLILISHAHRDHLDVDSITHFLPDDPYIFGPPQIENFIRDLGFTHFVGHHWWTETEVQLGREKFSFYALAACHWSNRGLTDAHNHLFCSWAMRRHGDHGAIFFAGDTSVIPKETKAQIREFVRVPIMVNLEPDGPNHSRHLMESTHQSVIDSMLSHFEVSEHPLLVKTYLMHHNAYELGTDRFNEGLIIKDQLLAYLRTDLSFENEEFKALPEFAQKELKADKLARIQEIGVENFIRHMETRFFSPKIGERLALTLKV